MLPEFEGEDRARAIAMATQWVNRAQGSFWAHVFAKETGMMDPHLRDQLLGELVKQGAIERDKDKNGLYRRVDAGRVRIDWRNAKYNPYPLWLPFNLHNMCGLSKKNVVVLAGESNGGKTATVLRIAHRNLRCNGGEHDEIHYFTCEMGDEELNDRALNQDHIDQWQGFEAYERYEDYHNVIYPDALNIVDYIDVSDKFWLMGEYIDQIHRKLRNGIAIVCIQKHKNSEFGMGGQFSAHRARLMLNLSYNIETQLRTCQVKKCKKPLTSPHPDGMQLDYTLDCGVITVVNDWSHVSKEQRKKRDEVAERALRRAEEKYRTEQVRREFGL